MGITLSTILCTGYPVWYLLCRLDLGVGAPCTCKDDVRFTPHFLSMGTERTGNIISRRLASMAKMIGAAPQGIGITLEHIDKHFDHDVGISTMAAIPISIFTGTFTDEVGLV